jgi:glucosamine--fructose-6-phosphate aminotransferase (isomerizing)
MGRRESGMANELREAPQAVAGQERVLAQLVAELVARLKVRPPRVVVTCARGSSAHAATFGKHLIELALGIPVAAAAPNIASVYGRALGLDGQFFLAISQSGRSDDLIAQAKSARDAGAITACIVNAPDSPLAAQCEFVLPMGAGLEESVAATKSFVATLAALSRLVGAWSDDRALASAVNRLPERLAKATALDWAEAVEALAGARSLVTIGRGPTLAIAREAALKLKEIGNLHAEPFSGAEFLHGPVALVSERYPILVFMPADEAAAGMAGLVSDLRGKGARVLVAGPGDPAPGKLAALSPDHPATDAICMIQSFYAMVVRLADRLGTDADRPRHLRKVTRTQ